MFSTLTAERGEMINAFVRVCRREQEGEEISCRQTSSQRTLSGTVTKKPVFLKHDTYRQIKKKKKKETAALSSFTSQP